jgi:hypothetical protein
VDNRCLDCDCDPCICADLGEPEMDDTVHVCPNCERPQQFTGLCLLCTAEMRETAGDPFWERLLTGATQ